MRAVFVADFGPTLQTHSVFLSLLHDTTLQRLIEAQKHAFAIRTALGDPGTPDRPFAFKDEIWAAVGDLLNDEFIER